MKTFNFIILSSLLYFLKSIDCGGDGFEYEYDELEVFGPIHLIPNLPNCVFHIEDVQELGDCNKDCGRQRRKQVFPEGCCCHGIQSQKPTN